MQSLTLNAIVLIAACALSTGATAQKTYKCGDAYSQLPCPGGVILDAADQRTSAQKMQSDLATGRDTRIASAMEKARLQQEKIDLTANTPPVKQETTGTAASMPTTQAKKKKKKTPDYFTAQVPGQKKKKKVPKKSAGKKDESTS